MCSMSKQALVEKYMVLRMSLEDMMCNKPGFEKITVKVLDGSETKFIASFHISRLVQWSTIFQNNIDITLYSFKNSNEMT